MSNITLDEWAPLLSREAVARRGTLLAIFAGIAILFLLIAALWQKKYTSVVQLRVDNKNAVQEVAGVATAIEVNQAKVARETLFSKEILDRIVVDLGYVTPGMSAIARERVKEDLIQDTEIINIDNQLLDIVVENTSASLAYETASMFADLFLKKSMATSSQETSDAFDFVVGQVDAFRAKLEDAEARLEAFRLKYPGVAANTEGNVNARIIELRREIEQANLKYAEFDQRRRTLERQISSESSSMAREYRANRTRQRVNDLQAQIDSLRLSYTDDYPDIVRLKQQINELLAAANRGDANPNIAGTGFIATDSLAYQTMRSELASVASEAASWRSRASQLNSLLKEEIKRSSVSGKVERELTELTRDYEINKKIYEELITSQESARLSMQLSAEQQGVLFSIQQPANYPVLPTGLRFMHIAAAGLLLGLLVPIFFLIIFLKLDTRIRTSSAVTDLLELPLLTTVPNMSTKNEKQPLFSRPGTAVGVVVLVVVLYIVVAIAKHTLGVSSTGAV